MGSDVVTYIPAITLSQKEPASEALSNDSLEKREAARITTNQPDRTDEILLSEVGGGSREALSLLFRRHSRGIYVLASRILRDVAEAEDLVQEVFLALSEKAKLFDPSKGAGVSWLMRIAYLRALDRRKYLGVRHHYTAQPIDDERLYASQGVVSIDHIEGRRLLERLRGELSAEQLQTLELHFFEGYSFQEIAERTHQSLGNVRNHYYRGLSRLRGLVFTENSHST